MNSKNENNEQSSIQNDIVSWQPYLLIVMNLRCRLLRTFIILVRRTLLQIKSNDAGL